MRPACAQKAGPCCDLAAERRRVAALFDVESEARAAGYEVIAGVDEVGRGCLAGPVYAGAVVFLGPVHIAGLDDSKVVPAEVRGELCVRIRRMALGVGLGAATPAEIDSVGIVPATLLAMRRALLNLGASGVEPRLVLFDAVHVPGLAVEQRSFIRGDARVGAIAAASIVAKTARDEFMEALDGEFPPYGFASHRGYGTPEHLDALRRHGPSPAHRLTFEGVVLRRRASGARTARAVRN